jgi:hypothetical protein
MADSAATNAVSLYPPWNVIVQPIATSKEMV